jgi:predicted RecB family nuclease
MKHITATDFYNYFKCKWRVFMDKNTDPHKRDEVNYFLELLWHNGIAHEEKAVEFFQSQKDKTFVEVRTKEDADEDELKKGARETLLHMKSGVNFIYQGVLMHEGANSLFEQSPVLVGRPDILMRIKDVPSALGDFSYVPVDIKAGKGIEETDWGDRFNQAYLAQMNFYAMLLEEVLKHPVKEGYIFNVHHKFVKYPLSPADSSFQNVLSEIKMMVRGDTQKREPIISSMCGLCHWQSFCQKWAESHNDLTLLFYLGEKVKYGFYEMGINNMDDLANVDLTKFLPKFQRAKKAGFFYPSMRDELVKSLVTRAGLYVQEKAEGNNEVYIIRKTPDFPQTKKEIHYDIEDDPMNEFVYMHGFWIIEEGKEPYYHAIVATRDKTEEEITKELWAFFASNEGVPIYHYSGHEKHTCKKLMDKYHLDPEVYDAVFGRGGTAIDLYDWIVANTDWPLTSYGLKPICKYTGFAWSAEDAGGANSISWFAEYMDGKDEMMEKILTYNKEDCMATAHLKEWLIENA